MLTKMWCLCLVLLFLCFCVAYLLPHHRYYRGVIRTRNKGGTTTVFFVDHGETIHVPTCQVSFNVLSLHSMYFMHKLPLRLYNASSLLLVLHPQTSHVPLQCILTPLHILYLQISHVPLQFAPTP